MTLTEFLLKRVLTYAILASAAFYAIHVIYAWAVDFGNSVSQCSQLREVGLNCE